MKIFLLALLFPLNLLAQSFPVTNGKIIYSDTLQTTNATQSDLYLRAREWFATSFKSADAVLEMEDKEVGILIGKAYSDIPLSTTGMGKMKMWYTIKVVTKDNQAIYTFSNIQLQNYYNASLPSPEAQTQLLTGESFLLGSNKTRKGKVNQPLIEGRKEAARILEELTASLKQVL